MRMKYLFFLPLSLLFLKSYAQSGFDQIVTRMKASGDSILRAATDSSRTYYCSEFNKDFENFLRTEGSFDVQPDSLTHVSVLTSDDKLVRVFTWTQPSVNGRSFRYFGFLQWKEKKKGEVNVTRLEDQTPDEMNTEKMVFSAGAWPGALYYRLITTSLKGRKYYTLLGWKGKDLFSTMKTIDVLTIEHGKPQFGAAIFQSDKGLRTRILFEYNARASMSLNYDPKKKRIVFDHLSPSSPQQADKYASYGPDFTYDAYKWSKGQWVLIKDIDARNPASSDPRTPAQKSGRKEFYKPE